MRFSTSIEQPAFNPYADPFVVDNFYPGFRQFVEFMTKYRA